MRFLGANGHMEDCVKMTGKSSGGSRPPFEADIRSGGMSTAMNGGRVALGHGGMLFLSILLACAGCRSVRPPAPTNGQADPPSAPQEVAQVELRPGLLVRVQVLVTGKTEVDEKDRRISEAGIVTLPLVGNAQIAYLTVAEAQAVLRTAYSRYYVQPEVIIECQMESGDAAVSPWGYVTVLGRVKRPGQVNFPPTRDLTVSRAIQLAGGLDTSARSGAIRVTRTRSGFAERFQVDLDRIGARGETQEDVPLVPGDVVYVPEAAL